MSNSTSISECKVLGESQLRVLAGRVAEDVFAAWETRSQRRSSVVSVARLLRTLPPSPHRSHLPEQPSVYPVAGEEETQCTICYAKQWGGTVEQPPSVGTGDHVSLPNWSVNGGLV